MRPLQFAGQGVGVIETVHGRWEGKRALGRHPQWLVLVLTGLAFVLRVWGLGAQSLRGDEAFDVVLAERPAAGILAELRAAQPYPPLFPLGFKAWTNLAGINEFALRFPAACCSLLAVPLTFLLARRWLGLRAAMWAALLAAVQPLSIWYAQDGRMYAPLIVLSLASTVLAARLWAGERGWGGWLGYGLVTLAGLLTHYMVLLTLAAQQLIAVGVVLVRRDRALAARWALVTAGVGALYLPWVAWAWPLLAAHRSSWVQPASVPAMAWRMLRAYTVGLTLDERWAVVPALVALGLMIWATVACWRAGRRQGIVFLWALILVPLGSIAAGSLRRPMFDERYLVTAIAPILILAGGGLASLSGKRRLQLPLALLLIGGMVAAHAGYRFDPAYAKSRPWRALFDELALRMQEGDALVYTFPDPAPEVYTAGRWPVLLLPSTLPIDPPALNEQAVQWAGQYERLWLLPQWSPQWDETGQAQRALDAACERAAELHFDAPGGGWPVVLYHTPRLYRQEIRPLDARWEEIRLLGSVLRDPGGQAVDSLDVRPGDEIRLTLYWTADSEIDQDYTVFVHLLDQTGRLRGQQDNPPRGGTFPTSAWLPGEWVVDEYRVPLAPDAPPGAYTFEVGLYRPADAVRVAVSGADADVENRRVLIGGMQVK